MIPFFDALRALVRASESGDRRLELPVSNESCRLVVELNSKLDIVRMRHYCLGVLVDRRESRNFVTLHFAGLYCLCM
jgi:hypothetical protein